MNKVLLIMLISFSNMILNFEFTLRFNQILSYFFSKVHLTLLLAFNLRRDWENIRLALHCYL